MTERIIMHIDMDAFFASVEQLDHPELKDKPLAIGGGVRGVISTASYAARKFGVRSAMPIGLARRLCPRLVLVPPRIHRYSEISRRIITSLGDFSPLVEQASIDEAYIDATGLGRLFGSTRDIARAVKAAVRETTGGLTCSVGAAPLKFLAKIASDRHKPDGMTIIRPEDVPAFLRVLPVSDVPGVGKVFLEKLYELGIKKCGDVADQPRRFWEERFGKAGLTLYMRCQGIDPREVTPFRPPKSENAETTFDVDTTDREFLKAWLYRHADRVGKALRRQGVAGSVVSLKVKFADFSTVTRQTSLPEPTCATKTIYSAACGLLAALNPTRPMRLIGLGVSGFDQHDGRQFLPLASARHEEEIRRTRLDQTLDALNGQVVVGRLFKPGESTRIQAGCERYPQRPERQRSSHEQENES